MDNELEATAYHETGHALVSYLLGKGFKTVSILPNHEENTLGALNHLRDRSLIYNVLSGVSNLILDNDTIDKLVKQDICVAYGGYIAELLYGVDNKEGARADVSFISDLALSHEGDDCTDLNDYCYSKSKGLIEDNWFILEYIAKELLLMKELTYEEFDLLVKKGLHKLNNRKQFYTDESK